MSAPVRAAASWATDRTRRSTTSVPADTRARPRRHDPICSNIRRRSSWKTTIRTMTTTAKKPCNSAAVSRRSRLRANRKTAARIASPASAGRARVRRRYPMASHPNPATRVMSSRSSHPGMESQLGMGRSRESTGSIHTHSTSDVPMCEASGARAVRRCGRGPGFATIGSRSSELAQRARAGAGSEPREAVVRWHVVCSCGWRVEAITGGSP